MLLTLADAGLATENEVLSRIPDQGLGGAVLLAAPSTLWASVQRGSNLRRYEAEWRERTAYSLPEPEK